MDDELFRIAIIKDGSLFIIFNKTKVRYHQVLFPIIYASEKQPSAIQFEIRDSAEHESFIIEDLKEQQRIQALLRENTGSIDVHAKIVR